MGMSSFLLKVILSAAMFALTTLAGLVAIMLRRKIQKQHQEWNRRRTAWMMTMMSCFAGGVFLGTCFLDIFPHIIHHYEHFREKAKWETEFPLPFFFVCCGFFLIYLLEELILRVFANSKKQKLVANLQIQNIAKIGGCEKPDCVMSASTQLSEGDTVGKGLRACASCLEKLTHEAVITKYLAKSEKKIDVLRSVTFAFAISFHSVLEGLALGVQENSAGIVTLFISLIIHKGVEAFSVGLQISKSSSMRMVVSLIFAYALMTPLGAIIGDFITNMNIDELLKEGIIIGLESLAGGTFIYVTFLEVLAQERANDHSNLVQLGAIASGFLVINALQLYELASESGHAHSH